MAKRITISVPENLHDQINRWRDSFNLSKVFQDAVAEVIRRKEELQARISEEIPDIVDRLKREKMTVEKKWFMDGVNKGLEWAKAAHYQELKRILPQAAETLAGPGGDLRDYFQSALGAEAAYRQAKEGFDEFRRAFLEGWHKGVEDFWGMVKDRL